MKNTYFCFPFLSVLLMLCLLASLAVTRVSNLTTDQFALLEFRNRILDPQNVLANNWTETSSACSWVGVSCGIKHRRVISLDLANMNLTGTISPHLGNLSFLLYLNLMRNNFHGRLPKEMGQLRRLRLIQLSLNSLEGEIPPWLGNLHKVEKLGLQDNKFTGTIPPTVANLTNLGHLDLQLNQLSGSIPSTVYNMSSLQFIALTFNRLSGSIPDDLCRHLPKLEVFGLSNNDISGQIPSSIAECSRLQILVLSDTRLTGIIPRGLGNLTAMKQLLLGSTNLKGEIPKEIGNLHNLEIFDAPYVGLTGPIPFSIFNISSLNYLNLFNNSLASNLPDDMCLRLPKLEILNLNFNELSGHIPSSIGKCSNLQNLSLNSNQFSGLIPESIGNLSRLQLIDFAENNLEGNIPDSIFNLSQLSYLQLSSNSLAGFIPNTIGNLGYLEIFNIRSNRLTAKPGIEVCSFISSLANSRNLRHLEMSNNPLNCILPTSVGNLSTSLRNFYAFDCMLKGSTPVEIGNLSNIINLNLEINELSGSIPATIGSMQNIQGLFLDNNKLQGSIPQSVCGLKSLYDLRLSFNKLHGPLPICLGNLTSLGYIYLGSNKLNSSIHSTLWSLKHLLEVDLSSNFLIDFNPLDIGDLKALRYLNLSSNLLSSTISTTLGGLENLVSLDLSNNMLHGHIPESFGDLISLEFLDLSNNNLSGIIPKSLERLSYLNSLNLSLNRLEGEIPLGGPFQNFSSLSFLKNYALCGPPKMEVPPCKSSIHGHSKVTTVSVLKYCLPAIASIILIVLIIIVYKRCRRSTKLPIKEDLLSLQMWRRISHAELLQATGGFGESNFLGSGSFGSVYRGRLPDGTDVAIKVFNLQLEGAFRSFDTECEAMRNIIHRNLVKVITCCSNLDFKALVLDFMPNGSLDKWLHSESENYFLDILQRVDIMLDVAYALEYLHAGQATPIVHCDLKPSNILLDEDMVAHVGDFGISKLLEEGEFMAQTKTLATIGYMAPEYGSAGIVSIKCDHYSYGILLIETFTKKKPTDAIFSEVMTVRDWVKSSLSNGIIDIADAKLLRREDDYFIVKANCTSSIMELALSCSAELPEERKEMKDVVAALKKIKQEYVNKVEQV